MVRALSTKVKCSRVEFLSFSLFEVEFHLAVFFFELLKVILNLP